MFVLRFVVVYCLLLVCYVGMIAEIVLLEFDFGCVYTYRVVLL